MLIDLTNDTVYEIEFSSTADKYFKKLSNKEYIKRIRDPIYNIKDPHDSKKMKRKFKGLNKI